jgi:class 3 adenylate cyclase
LFDVDTYIKRTVGYVLMTGIVAGGYFAFQTVVKTMILDPWIGSASEQVYPLLFALLTVFAFNPLSQQVQQVVDKLFFRKAYDYKSTIASVSDSLTSLVDINAFITKVMNAIRQNLFVDKTGVILLDSRKHACESVFLEDAPSIGLTAALKHDPCLTPDDPLLTLLGREKKLITKYDIAEDPKYAAIRDSCGRRFSELGASLALPLFYHDKFTGMLALGHKKSGHFFTREDIDLLQTLSSMTSTAIEQVREKDQRATLMQLFSKHVSPSVAETLWEQREHFMEGGRPKSQSMTVTAMFTDLQGFSTLSERQSPELLMGWLNTYLEMMTNTVMEYGGVVDDFFGDGVKINFGVPVPKETEAEIGRDAINAVQCALAMEQRMKVLNAQMIQQGQEPLRMRVGIYTGPVVAGSLGSANRMKYTTIGDTVNTAARLESFDKDLVIPELKGSPCRILIGGSTLAYVDQMFHTKFVGELALKGKQEKIAAYCVLGHKTAEVDGAVGLHSEDSAFPHV